MTRQKREIMGVFLPELEGFDLPDSVVLAKGGRAGISAYA